MRWYIGRVEFEKLCVLFFKFYIEGIACSTSPDAKGSYQVYNSFFGPLVSTSDDPVTISQGASKLSNTLRSYGLNIYDKSKGYIFEPNQDNVLEYTEEDYAERDEQGSERDEYEIEKKLLESSAMSRSVSFVDRYSRQYAGYHSLANDSKIKMPPLVTSYTDYLTLRAIGATPYNRALSLVAELDILHTTDEITDSEGVWNICSEMIRKESDSKETKKRDALKSGLWKYACYQSEDKPLEKIRKLLLENSNCNYNPADDVDIAEERPLSSDPRFRTMLVRAGSLLVKIYGVYSEIYDRFIANNRDRTWGPNEALKIDESYKAGVGLDHYKSMFDEGKKLVKSSIEETIPVLQMLNESIQEEIDYCDALIAAKDGEIRVVSNFVLVEVSPEEEFTANIEDPKAPRVVGTRVSLRERLAGDYHYYLFESDKFTTLQGICFAVLTNNTAISHLSMLYCSTKLMQYETQTTSANGICVLGKQVEKELGEIADSKPFSMNKSGRLLYAHRQNPIEIGGEGIVVEPAPEERNTQSLLCQILKVL
jgi:hypothetical protein